MKKKQEPSDLKEISQPVSDVSASSTLEVKNKVIYKEKVSEIQQ